MTKIAVSNFKGTLPLLSAKLLPDNYAQTAENVDLSRGKIEPLAGPDTQGTVQKATPAKIFKHSTKWVCWASVVNHVRSWIYDTNPRLYFTDGTKPKQTKLDLINDCLSSGSADTTYDMGIAAPTSAPTLAFTYDGSPGDDIQATIAYVFTYLTSWDEESAPSPASAVGEIYDDGYCTVTCPTPAGERAASTLITKIRVYRVAYGTAGAEYQFLAEESIGGATTDSIDRDGSNYAITPDAELGEAITTEDYDAPPATMEGLISISAGIMAGFLANKLYLNEPYIPYAFPEKYIKEAASDIVGLGFDGFALIIVSETGPIIADGVDPQTMIIGDPASPEGGVAARGIVSTPDGVYYPSSNGLIRVRSGEKPVNITKNVYTEEQWQALSPSTIIGCYFESMYYGFFINTSTGFYFKFDEEYPYIVTLDLGEYPSSYAIQIKDVYVDPTSDTLFILVYSADTNYYVLKHKKHGSNILTGTWKSKVFSLERPTNMGAYRVKKSSGNTNLKTYAAGAQKNSITVSSEVPGRLLGGFLETDWEFQVSGTIDIDEVALTTTLDEFRDDA